MEVLVLYPDPTRLNLISLCLESETNINVTLTHSFADTIKHLLDHSNVDLIIAGDAGQIPNVIKYLLSVNSKIPVITVAADAEKAADRTLIGMCEFPILAEIKDSEVPTKLLEVIQNHYRNVVVKEEHKEVPYCRVNVQLLCDITPLIADIFVRLSKTKFVKIFNAGSVFTERDLNRFLGIKKIDYLYVHKSSASEFIKRLNNRLTTITDSTGNNEESLFSTAGQAHEALQDLHGKFGFSEPVVELTKNQVKLAMKAIGKFPRLTRVFEGSLLQNVNDISRHSLMLAHVSCAIAAQLEWHSESTFQKLVIASLLHDITLTRAEFASISNKDDLNKAKETLSPGDYKTVESHPFAAAKLVDRFLEIPGDIYLVVLQHHERPDGTGFPHGLRAAAIAPLSAIFIVAHELVEAYLHEGSKFDIQKFWNENAERYSSGTFKKISKCFVDSKVKAA